MASQAFNALNNRGTHAVGNLNSIHVRTLPYGAILTEDADNFVLVALGFNDEGERTASILDDATKDSYLLASPERVYLGEHIANFYNGEGERGRIVHLDKGLRFETSAFKATEPKNGDSAHFDATTKKFLVHDGAHADFATADKKFLVVEVTNAFGQEVVRLEVQ